MVQNHIGLIDSSAIIFHPIGNLPERLVKPANETPDFPEVIYTFYQRRGEGKCPKFLEIPPFRYGTKYMALIELRTIFFPTQR